MVTVAPYGTWQSPIGADLITKQVCYILNLSAAIELMALGHYDQRNIR